MKRESLLNECFWEIEVGKETSFMKIRQKFFVLSGIVGVIIAVMSCVGYYTAYTNLERSVEGELSATGARSRRCRSS